MKIIKPSVEFFGEVPTDYESALKFIELAGRTCYKSEDKIGPGTAEKFVKKLIKAGHLAMVEHSNFVVRKSFDIYSPPDYPTEFKYLNVHMAKGFVYIGGNLTAWFQSALSEGPAPIFEPFCAVYSELFGHNLSEVGRSDWHVCQRDEIPKELHRYSAKFICDRGVSHELVRHRLCSFAQESTRYVSYGGKDMEFIEPWWWDHDSYMVADGQHVVFNKSCQWAEEMYNGMLSYGAPPQAARAVLPNALKTEIVVTADAAEWAHIRKLRTSPAAHPDIRLVMDMMPWESFL